MKILKYAAALLAVVILSSCACEDYPQVRELARRVIPDHHRSFVFEAYEDTVDCFELSMQGLGEVS